MALKFPKSMNECIYFTNRQIDNQKIIAWVYKKDCPKCKKAKMGKPIGEEGNVKIRAKEYVCPQCSYTEEKTTHEESCQTEIQYTCDCGFSGETTTEYKRKSFDGVKAIIFTCEKCKKKIGITKKMKQGKKKGEDMDDDE